MRPGWGSRGTCCALGACLRDFVYPRGCWIGVSHKAALSFAVKAVWGGKVVIIADDVTVVEDLVCAVRHVS